MQEWLPTFAGKATMHDVNVAFAALPKAEREVRIVRMHPNRSHLLYIAALKLRTTKKKAKAALPVSERQINK
jgi:hypothetical protein